MGTILTVVSPFLVFLLLGLFAYPCTDDWVAIAIARDQGVWSGTVGHLLGWGGRYSSCLLGLGLMALPGWPAAYLLAILANLLLLLLTAAVLLPSALPARRWWALLVAGIFAATLPCPAQGLYWLVGMLSYVLPFQILALVLWWAGRPGGGLRRAALLILSGFLLAGFGETVAALAGTAVIACWCLGLAQGRFVLWGILLGALADVLAPGTWVRLAVAAGPAQHPQGGVLTVLGSTLQVYAGLIDALFQPAPLLLGLALGMASSRTPGAVPARRMPVALAVVAVGCLLALVPSVAALGMVEGRQQDAVWCLLYGWSLAAAWWLGAWRPRWFAGRPLQVAILLAGVLALVRAVPPESAWSLAAWGAAVAVLMLGMVQAARSAVIWELAALAVLSLWTAPRMAIAAVDLLVRAPYRRAELAVRDAGVRALAAEGVARVRVPLADGRWFPAMISVGDLSSTRSWWNDAYARVHGLESVVADPRAVVPEAVLRP